MHTSLYLPYLRFKLVIHSVINYNLYQISAHIMLPQTGRTVNDNPVLSQKNRSPIRFINDIFLPQPKTPERINKRRKIFIGRSR